MVSCAFPVTIWCLVLLCGVAGQAETCEATGTCGGGGGAVEAAARPARLLADVCVRGVEIAPQGSQALLLANLTSCAVASLLAVPADDAAPTAQTPLDAAAAAAVLRADALVLQDGLRDAGAWSPPPFFFFF